MECPQCSRSITESDSYCPDCGQDLDRLRESVEESICPNCDVSVDSKYCPECGLNFEEIHSEFASNTEPKTGKNDSKTAASVHSKSDEKIGERQSSSLGTKSSEGERGTKAGRKKQHSETKREHNSSVGPKEVYCIGCGGGINKQAEMCPECGMNQVPPGGWDSGNNSNNSGQDSRNNFNDIDEFKYQNLARKSKSGNMLLGLFMPPIAYINLGKPLMAVLNVLTANFLLLGFIIVPIHVTRIISSARKQIKRG